MASYTRDGRTGAPRAIPRLEYTPDSRYRVIRRRGGLVYAPTDPQVGPPSESPAWRAVRLPDGAPAWSYEPDRVPVEEMSAWGETLRKRFLRTQIRVVWRREVAERETVEREVAERALVTASSHAAADLVERQRQMSQARSTRHQPPSGPNGGPGCA